MSAPDEMPDDTLRALAAGVYPPTFAEERALAAEVLRLREARDDAGDAFDVLVRRVWEAATGDTHEGPASVEVLLEAVVGLRARADGAEAARDALRAAVREYVAANVALAGVTITSPYSRYVETEGRLDAARADLDAALAGEG